MPAEPNQEDERSQPSSATRAAPVPRTEPACSELGFACPGHAAQQRASLQLPVLASVPGARRGCGSLAHTHAKARTRSRAAGVPTAD